MRHSIPVFVVAIAACSSPHRENPQDEPVTDAANNDSVPSDGDTSGGCTCAAQQANCGFVVNPCGDVLHCGSCGLSQQCGLGGVRNVCGCTRDPNACVGKCGTTVDNCDVTIDCGANCTTAVMITAPREITAAGQYILMSDIGNGSDVALSIHDTANVALNCNGHVIRGNFKITNVSNISVSSCFIQSPPDPGLITWSNITEGVFANNTVASLQIDAGTKLQFLHNRIRPVNTLLEGLLIRNTTDVLVQGNSFKAPTSTSINALLDVRAGIKTRIVGNQFDGSWSGDVSDLLNPNGANGADDGILLIDQSECEVSGNTVANTWDAAIETLGRVNHCTIDHNQMSQSLIGIGGWFWNSWSNNVVANNVADGVNTLFVFSRIWGLRLADSIRDYGERDIPPETAVYFLDNTFIRNIHLSGHKGGAANSSIDLTHLDRQNVGGAPLTTSNLVLGNNHFANNKFITFAPTMLPASMFVDDGGNLCPRGSTSAAPLACARP